MYLSAVSCVRSSFPSRLVISIFIFLFFYLQLWFVKMEHLTILQERSLSIQKYIVDVLTIKS